MRKPHPRLKWTAWVFVAAWIALLAASLPQPARAGGSDNSDVETQLKAAFIYNFVRFIEWPPRPGSGPVRIGILGHGDLSSSLEEVIRGKAANGHSIEVLYINAGADAERCEILLIERSEAKHVKDISQALAGKPVLIVCDGGNCFRDGATIAFQMVDESVRFQINQEAAAHAGLKISSQLLKVALPGAGTHL